MAILGKVTTTVFQALLSRFGIANPAPTFQLSDTVAPVAIVDSNAPLIVSTPIRGVPFSAGVLAAPIINSILADTGALNAGNYDVLVLSESVETTAVQIAMQRRDAANAANIWSQAFWNQASANATPRSFRFSERVNLAQGERVRLINTGAGAVGSAYQASIWVTAA